MTITKTILKHKPTAISHKEGEDKIVLHFGENRKSARIKEGAGPKEWFDSLIDFEKGVLTYVNGPSFRFELDWAEGVKKVELGLSNRSDKLEEGGNNSRLEPQVRNNMDKTLEGDKHEEIVSKEQPEETRDKPSPLTESYSKEGKVEERKVEPIDPSNLNEDGLPEPPKFPTIESLNIDNKVGSDIVGKPVINQKVIHEDKQEKSISIKTNETILARGNKNSLDLSSKSNNVIKLGRGNKPLPSEMKSIEEIITFMAETLLEEEKFEMLITSKGLCLVDSEVRKVDLNTDSIGESHSLLLNEADLSFSKKDFEVVYSDWAFTLHLDSFNSELIFNLSRSLNKGQELSLSPTNEMINKIEALGGGLIVTTFNKNLLLEHSISILKSLDKDAELLLVSVGENLKITKSAMVSGENSLEVLDGTHIKYILMDEKHLTMLGLNNVTDLVYKGKVVVVGIEANSAHSAFIKLYSSCKDNKELSKFIMSTVAFVEPKLKISNGNITLEETEVVTLNSSLSDDILKGDITKERFNRAVERPSKVYKLSDSTKHLTQVEELNHLLKIAVDKEASDIHLAVGTMPTLRVKGKLEKIGNERLTPQIIKHIISIIISSESQRIEYEKSKKLNTSYSVNGVGRFRVQINTQRGTGHVVMRHTPFEAPNAKEMRIPKSILDSLKQNSNGLVLITGPTGSGKSTTSAVLLNELKNSEALSIISLEDPIEFIQNHGKGIFIQMEVPNDVEDFSTGLKSILRSDPDVTQVGEMRDEESIQTLLRFSNSGHLAISSYHNSSIPDTFNAILNRVDSARRKETLSTLASSLNAIVYQILIPGIKKPIVPVFEYIILDATSRGFIAKDDISGFTGHLKTLAYSDNGSASYLDYELEKLYKAGEISINTFNKYARSKAGN